MAAALEAWRCARVGLVDAVRRRDRAVTRAERKLAAVLGGITLARWQQLVAGQALLRSPAVGRAVFRARRDRPRAEAALAELNEVQAIQAAKVADAEVVLAEAVRGWSKWAALLGSE